MEMEKIIEQALTDKKLTYQVSEEGNVFSLIWNLNKCINIQMYIAANSNIVEIIAEYGFTIADANIPRICEFAARVNSRNRLTKLQLDFDDCHLEVHIANAFASFEEDSDYEGLKIVIDSFICLVNTEMDALFEPIMHILYSNISPEEACEEYMMSTCESVLKSISESVLKSISEDD